MPCWIDIEQPDKDAASNFYGSLFGWTFENAMPPDAPGYYLIARLDGQDVAAIGMPDPISTAAWNTYVAVDDADAAAETVSRAGGQVTSEPQDAGPGGRWAGVLDPTGAAFRLWQARRRLGAQVVNSPGSWNFSDLHTGDAARAKSFYADVFGWEADELDFGDGEGATMWRRPGYGDHLAATVDPDIHARQSGISAPPGFADAVAWLAPLQVTKRPTGTSRSPSPTATTASPPPCGSAPRPVGPARHGVDEGAVVRDPQGAVFTLSQFDPQG